MHVNATTSFTAPLLYSTAQDAGSNNNSGTAGSVYLSSDDMTRVMIRVAHIPSFSFLGLVARPSRQDGARPVGVELQVGCVGEGRAHFESLFVISRALTFCRHTPWSYGMPSTGGSSLPTTMRMVNRVHHHTSNDRSTSQPAFSTCLTQINILLIRVRYCPYGRHTFRPNSSNFPRSETQ